MRKVVNMPSILDIIHITTRRNYFVFLVVNAWNSLSNNVVESVSLNVFKKSLDGHFQTRNKVLNLIYDFQNNYALTALY